MTYEQFLESLEQSTVPSVLASVPLRALWWDAKGQWNTAHEAVQDDPSSDAAWVHAFLHRKEGDLGNARYWYRNAGKPPVQVSLEQEWEGIVRALLAQ